MIDRVCVSLNAVCNLNCSYCHFASKKNNEFSKLNEFQAEEAMLLCKNIVNYIKKCNLHYFKLGIVGSGEPLLSFDAIKVIINFFIDSSVRNIIKIYVVSNGTLLNEEIVDFFYKCRDIVELDISLDGDLETNKRFRGSYPDLLVYKAKFGKMPKINTVVTAQTIKDQNKILSFFYNNGFIDINFSKVFGTSDESIIVPEKEYELFLERAKSFGIRFRQDNTQEKFDCTKYGRLCGVGKNNIFITRTGVYPCGRFMDLKKFVVGQWFEPIDVIEKRISIMGPCPKGECYYEYYKVGN